MNLFAARDAQYQRPDLLHLFDIRNVMNLGATSSRMEKPSLIRRAPDSSSSSGTACTDNGNSDTCQKPTTAASTTLPIALGIGVPVFVAAIMILFFYRKYRKNLKAEDVADEEKYKSMDFGMDLDFAGKKNKKKGDQGELGVPPQQHLRGLSLEEGDSPYFLPVRNGGRNSVDSLASLGRSIVGDPYRHQSQLGSKTDDMSIRSPSPRGRTETISTTSGSIFNGKSNLLGHAQSNPRSAPPRGQSLPPAPDLPHNSHGGLAPATTEVGRDSYMAAVRKSNNYLGQFIHSREPSTDPHADIKLPEDFKVDSATPTLFGNEKSPSISVAEIFSTPDTSPPGTAASTPMTTQPAPSHKPLLGETVDSFHSAQATILDANNPNHGLNSGAQGFGHNSEYSNYDHDSQSQEYDHNAKHQNYLSDGSNYGNYGETPFKVTPPSPPRQSQTSLASHPQNSDYRDSNLSRDSGSVYGGEHPPRGQSMGAQLPEINENHEHYDDGVDEGLRNLDFDVNRLSVLMRPLPPDEPDENPEQRANRIRSFYKEYFDDSKQTNGPPPQPFPQQQQQQGRGQHYEDYDGEYQSNGYSIYDQNEQGFIVGGAPFAAPITRRAMTPPPRAPPRNFRSGPSSNHSSQYGGNTPRNGSSMSGMSGYNTPRMGSSMSNYRPGNGSERGRSKKQVPPPQPLMSLKTPALLKDDSALYGAFDLAPPPSYRDRQNGKRSDSPLGTERPYSPTVRAHTPLQSAYDELPAMPSPHTLRKSGTFTGLDFAPGYRFRGNDPNSDTASIRSGTSQLSTVHMNALRAGAHRISRLPKGDVGTRDDIMTGLKPKWDLTY